MNRKISALLGIVILLGAIAGTGCATKKFVTGEMATLDQKVEGVETSVEENQKRLKEHDQRLSSIGDLISQHDSQFEAVDGKFDAVDGKIEEVRKLSRGTLLFKETLRNSEAKFQFDSFALSEEATAKLDAFVQRLIDENKGVFIEIQGHTDSTGEESYNLLLGTKRAEAVQDYLYKKHHIPLHRMEVISYGSSSPVADNATREGRSENRRVEILVYE